MRRRDRVDIGSLIGGEKERKRQFYSSEKFAGRSFHSFTSGAGERIFILLPRVKSRPQKVGDF